MPNSTSQSEPTSLTPVRALCAGLIDYAGLYPPAKLPMDAVVEAYARDLVGSHAWMLGRLVCPASRLGELSTHAAALMPGTFATSGYREHAVGAEPWGVTVVADVDLPRAVEMIGEFNARHSTEDAGLAMADAVEFKITSAGQVEALLDEVPDELTPFVEIPVDRDCRGLVAALAGEQCCAKIRTGGVTPEAFPTCDQVAEFLHACNAADVPFKATAGLHHVVRGSHALTYEPGSACATMHGFLNVFAAAALARAGRLPLAETVALLGESDPRAIKFDGAKLSWRRWTVDAAAIAHVRESFALSYGSCSFEEPVAELSALGLIE